MVSDLTHPVCLYRSFSCSCLHVTRWHNFWCCCNNHRKIRHIRVDRTEQNRCWHVNTSQDPTTSIESTCNFQSHEVLTCFATELSRVYYCTRFKHQPNLNYGKVSCRYVSVLRCSQQNNTQRYWLPLLKR